MLHPLTERQEEIFSFICSFAKEQNYPPTIPEIQEKLSIKNPGAIHKALEALQKKGYIVRIKGQHRGLDFTTEARELLQ